MAWNHKAVFESLASRYGVNTSKENPLTYLYKQQPDCAVLYSDIANFHRHPLHLNPGRSSWNPAIYKTILPAIELVKLESRSESRRHDRFLFFEVVDWDEFAKALGLCQ